MTPRPRPQPIATPAASPSARSWLLLVHQLPPTPSNLRVRTWRRLQQLGALPVKQAVYVLPDRPEAREDFEWLKAEIEGAGGEAVVLIGRHLDSWSDDALVEEFRRVRQAEFADLAKDVEAALKRAARTRRPSGTRAPAVDRLSGIFRDRLAALEAIDFFGSAGRDRVIALIDQLASAPGSRHKTERLPASSGVDATQYHGRLWVTRPRPGVDRMASAWLIRRFIDPKPRFGFAADKTAVPADAVPFDMYGVEFTHHGGDCTFETLCAVFGIRDTAVARLAAIVHDLDLKDGRFGAPEGPTVAAMIDGLQLAHEDDDVLLAQGIAMFDSLYRSFARAARAAGPRVLARPKKKAKRR